MPCRARNLLFPCLTFVAAWGTAAPAQAPRPAVVRREVRQIVTFLFQPGRAEEARAIYARELRPAYTAATALKRFRAYREAESPQPLDLVVVSSYAGMAGMDEANAQLRQPVSTGRSALQWYATLSSMTAHHHDQFVEMLPSLSDSGRAANDPGRGLTVFEYLRVTPGSHDAFERLLPRLRAREAEARVVRWSETGRMLVSDGWDYLRISAIDDLGSWHSTMDVRRAPSLASIDALVAVRKVIIVRADTALAVR